MQSPINSEFVAFKPNNFKLDSPPICANLFLHARDTSNVGDLISTPFNYFTIRGESSVADFWGRVNAGEDGVDNIIVGGGGFGRFVRTPMYYERLHPRKNLILWGAFTDPPNSTPMPEDFIDRCSLIGTRDFYSASLDGEKVVFCPCASAMNRAFDIARPAPVHKTVCFFNRNRNFCQSDLFEGYPKMDNYGEFTNTLDFLASGEVVITNSYHGLYWATLLGRKVICLFDRGKFAQFKWTPVYAQPEACKTALKKVDEIPSYPEALTECRVLNIAFYQKVLAILG